MATSNKLNYGWLSDLTNAHHDGTTQQIDDLVQAYTTDNQVFNQKRDVLHQARQTEDEVWLKSQRDAAVPLLDAADKRQDGYISCVRYILTGHSGLPDGEATKPEAKQCLQVFKDFKFRTDDAMGAESDKIIQMHQNLQPHQSFLQQVGAWTFLTQAVAAAHEVRQYLSQRALTKGEFVKGELRTARRATDQAVADIYRTIEAMADLLPSPALTALFNQLKGLELYARQYYLGDGAGASAPTGSGGSSTPGTGTTGDGGSDPDTGSGGSTGTGSGGGSGSGSGSGTGDNGGSGSGSGSGTGGSGSGDDSGGFDAG